MNWKSERLTNVLLFIIACILVLWAICVLIWGIWRHKSFAWRMGEYKMQWQYKYEDYKNVEWQCASKNQWSCQNKESCPHANLEELPAAPATAAAE